MVMVGPALSREFIAHECAPAEIVFYDFNQVSSAGSEKNTEMND
jgi:hypothetical protein